MEGCGLCKIIPRHMLKNLIHESKHHSGEVPILTDLEQIEPTRILELS